MYHSILKFSKFSAVPASGGSYKITGDSLKLVNLGALAVWTFLKIQVCILISAVHTAVSVVVY